MYESGFEIGHLGLEMPGGRRIDVSFPILNDEYSPGSLKVLINQVIVQDQYRLWGRIKPGDVVLDIGASIGLFSWMVSWMGGISYAFEPSPKEFPSLVSMIEENMLSVEAENVAVGDIIGMVRFSPGQNMALGDGQVITEGFPPMHVTLEQAAEEWVEVDITTVDHFVESRGLTGVELIKVDTEGYERNVLSGARKTISDLSPIIILASYHRPDDGDVLPSLIHDINPNYRMRKIDVGGVDTDPCMVFLPPTFHGEW